MAGCACGAVSSSARVGAALREPRGGARHQACVRGLRPDHGGYPPTRGATPSRSVTTARGALCPAPRRPRRRPRPPPIPMTRPAGPPPTCRAPRCSPGPWSAWPRCASARTSRRRGRPASTRSAPGHPVRAAPAPTGRWRRPNRASLPPHPARPVQAGQASDSADRPGDQAELPTQIPPKGWWQVTRRAFKESSADNVGILAGGIAYAAFLAIPPALIAGMSLFGLVADPATIAQQAEGVLAALPRGGPTAAPRPDRRADPDQQRRAQLSAWSCRSCSRCGARRAARAA